MIVEVEVRDSVHEKQTRPGEKVMELKDHFPCLCV